VGGPSDAMRILVRPMAGMNRFDNCRLLTFFLLSYGRVTTRTHTFTRARATHTQEVYAEQIKLIRPVVMRQDPIGLFRNRFLSELFDLPYLV
jgi:hypothetical protein